MLTPRKTDELIPFFLLVLIVLAPMWLLSSLPTGLYPRFGLHPLTLVSVLLVYVLPLLLGWRLVVLPRERVRETLFKALLSVASFAVFGGVLELGLRWTGYDLDAKTKGRVRVYYAGGKRSDQLSKVEDLSFELVPSNIWGHQYASNERGYFNAENAISYRINAAGYRDAEFARQRKPSTIRIALLGDSFAFGEGVKKPHTAATLLETLLADKAGCPVEVYNFSVPSYGASQYGWLLENRVLDYAPDIVIVWYFLNDIEKLPREKQEMNSKDFLGNDDPEIFFPVLRRYSALARFAGRRLDRQVRSYVLVSTYLRAYTGSEAKWKAMVDDLKNTLSSMANVAAQSRTPIVLFVHPMLFRLQPNGYPFTEIHQMVIQFAKQAGFVAYDLFEAFQGRDAEELWVHPTDQHPNEVGHALAARYAAAKLEAILPLCAGPSADPASIGPIRAGEPGDGS